MYVIVEKRDQCFGYSYKDADTIKMCILGSFLASDVCSRPSTFKEWVWDYEYQTTASNITGLEKEGDNIILSDLYDEDDPPSYLQLTREQFLYVLDTWEQLYKEGPKQIIIIMEDGKITMTGMNEPDA